MTMTQAQNKANSMITDGRRRFCGARKKDGSSCRLPAGFGTPDASKRRGEWGIGPCKFHGGAMQPHRARANRIRAQEAVSRFGLPREIEADQALIEELHRCAGHVAQLGRLIESGSAAEAESAYKLYLIERTQMLKVAQTVEGLGIDQRRLEVQEFQATILAGVIKKVLRDLELTSTQRDRAPALVRQHLLAVSGSQADTKELAR